MTEDHLFPRALVIPGQRRVTQLLKRIDPNYRGRQGTFLAQNGVKKATLCADCNNKVLGTELDPALIDAYLQARTQMERVKYPIAGGVLLHRVNLNRVARAVAGHMLALDDKPNALHKLDRQLRRFVLYPEKGLHSSMRFHMWLYPFHRQGIMKDINHFTFGNASNLLWISAFKTYPLAFAFSTEINHPGYDLAGVCDLTPYVTSDTEALFHIRVQGRPLVDINWPYAPHRNGGILLGANNSLTTAPFKKAKKG